MPEFMKQSLIEHGLMETYSSRPPYQQNDYVWWIGSPAKEETRQKRLNQMLEELETGDRYMNMAWRPRKKDK